MANSPYILSRFNRIFSNQPSFTRGFSCATYTIRKVKVVGQIIVGQSGHGKRTLIAQLRQCYEEHNAFDSVTCLYWDNLIINIFLFNGNKVIFSLMRSYKYGFTLGMFVTQYSSMDKEPDEIFGLFWRNFVWFAVELVTVDKSEG